MQTLNVGLAKPGPAALAPGRLSHAFMDDQLAETLRKRTIFIVVQQKKGSEYIFFLKENVL